MAEKNKSVELEVGVVVACITHAHIAPVPTTGSISSIIEDALTYACPPPSMFVGL